MRNGNRFKTGIAAAIGTGLLVVTPTMSSAHAPASWNTCPAFDTEPLCGLVAHPASNGSGDRPTTVDPLPRRRSSDDMHVDVSCTPGSSIVIVACAE